MTTVQRGPARRHDVDAFVACAFLAFDCAIPRSFGDHSLQEISANLWIDPMFCNYWETPIAFDLTWRGEKHTFILSQDVPTREEGQGYADIEPTHFHIVTTQGKDAMEDVRLGCNTEVLGTFGSFVGETLSVGGVQKTRFERSANRFWSVEQYVFDIAKRCLGEKANWPEIKRSSKDDTCSPRLSTAAFAARSQAGTGPARRGGGSKTVIGGRIERRPGGRTACGGGRRPSRVTTKHRPARSL